MPTVGVICESRFDFDVLRALLINLTGKTDPEYLDFVGIESGESFTKWPDVWKINERRRRPIRTGRPVGQGGEARTARLALLLFNGAAVPVDAVVLLRDSDGQVERRDALCTARDAEPWKYTVAVGVAHVKIECWVLTAFQASSENEQSRLRTAKDSTGFSVQTQAHRLNAKDDSARSAKRVLRDLTDGNPARQLEAIRTCPVNLLRDRGQEVSIATFVEELQDRILPLLG